MFPYAKSAAHGQIIAFPLLTDILSSPYCFVYISAFLSQFLNLVTAISPSRPFSLIPFYLSPNHCLSLRAFVSHCAESFSVLYNRFAFDYNLQHKVSVVFVHAVDCVPRELFPLSW